MAPSKTRKPCPSAANTGSRVQFKKQQTDSNPSWVLREITATITIGMLVSIVMWSCVFGMSGNMGPGDGVVLGPVAEASDHE